MKRAAKIVHATGLKSHIFRVVLALFWGGHIGNVEDLCRKERTDTHIVLVQVGMNQLQLLGVQFSWFLWSGPKKKMHLVLVRVAFPICLLWLSWHIMWRKIGGSQSTLFWWAQGSDDPYSNELHQQSNCTRVRFNRTNMLSVNTTLLKVKDLGLCHSLYYINDT